MFKGIIASTVLAACIAAAPAAHAADKTFELKIGDTVVPIEAGETVDVPLAGGNVKVTLTRKEFVSFDAPGFNFVHPSSLSVARTELGAGINQYLLATGVGTVVIIQEYQSLDPTSLVPLMLQEMTKESVAAGAQVKQQATTRTTPGGRTLSGLAAVQTDKSGGADYEVVAYGKDDAGLIAVTRIDHAYLSTDSAVIDRFWQTFEIK